MGLIQPPEEPYLNFRRAVEGATKEIGGNMEGYVLAYRVPKAKLIPPPENIPGDNLLVHSHSGPAPVLDEIILHLATLAVESRLQTNRGDMYVTLECFKADLLRNLIRRQKERQP